MHSLCCAALNANIVDSDTAKICVADSILGKHTCPQRRAQQIFVLRWLISCFVNAMSHPVGPHCCTYLYLKLCKRFSCYNFDWQLMQFRPRPAAWPTAASQLLLSLSLLPLSLCFNLDICKEIWPHAEPRCLHLTLSPCVCPTGACLQAQ